MIHKKLNLRNSKDMIVKYKLENETFIRITH